VISGCQCSHTHLYLKFMMDVRSNSVYAAEGKKGDHAADRHAWLRFGEIAAELS
jgi:hypothetical protein